MALGAIAKIAGKSRYVSKWAAKVAKGEKAFGIFRTGNGFAHKITKFYPGPNSTLVNASKTLKNGKDVSSQIWTWPDGTTKMLTRKSDGFFSCVTKSAEGKVVERVISHGPNHLLSKGVTPNIVNGKYTLTPWSMTINGNTIESCVNGVKKANQSANQARYLVKDTIKEAEHRFNCIG